MTTPGTELDRHRSFSSGRYNRSGMSATLSSALSSSDAREGLRSLRNRSAGHQRACYCCLGVLLGITGFALTLIAGGGGGVRESRRHAGGGRPAALAQHDLGDQQRVKMMTFALKTRKSVLKTRIFVSKTRNFLNLK